MDTKEALAQALGTVMDYPTIDGTTPSWDETAAAILDALRAVDGGRWDICKDIGKNMGDLYEVGREYGAQQERERLRAAIDKTPSPVFLPQDIERIYAGESLPLVPRHVLRDLLADPEDDR